MLCQYCKSLISFPYRIIRKKGSDIQIIECRKEGISLNSISSDIIQKFNKKNGEWETIQEGNFKLI